MKKLAMKLTRAYTLPMLLVAISHGIPIAQADTNMNTGGSPDVINEDIVTGGTVVLDLDIDTNNNDGLEHSREWGPPKEPEDVAETGGRGKFVFTYTNKDSDGDGVPDFADGLGLPPALDTVPTAAGCGQESRLVPVRLELRGDVNLAEAVVKFSYKASVPRLSTAENEGDIAITGTGTEEDPRRYHLNQCGMRLWTVDAPQRAESAETGKNVAAGEPARKFVPPDAAIPWPVLCAATGNGGSGGTLPNPIILYLEYAEARHPTAPEMEFSEVAGTGQMIHVLESKVTHGQTDTVKVTLLPTECVPDYDRDGMIKIEDVDRTTAVHPYIFWVNDDADGMADTDSADIPGSGGDDADEVPNGTRDLVDFFPVNIDLRHMLKNLPADEYEYRIAHPAGAFCFIEMPAMQTASDPEHLGAGSYLRNWQMAAGALFGTHGRATGTGTPLSDAYLQAAASGSGGILLEAVDETDLSLELVVVRKNGGEVFRAKRIFPVDVGPVDALYWRSDITGAAAGQNCPLPVEPANNRFAKRLKDRWFIFCHGYNVSSTEADGTNAEVFKRLYQCGNDSKFVGIKWKGNHSQIGGKLSPDYWTNVYNSFASSWVLRDKINALTGSEKEKVVIAGHSLGNMLVSSAICDHGLKAGKYFMTNSAVAREAYNPSHAVSERDLLSDPNWREYDDRLWASNWHLRFAEDDSRNDLTWKGRFASLKDKTSAYIYYSSGEDVAESATGVVPSLTGLVKYGGKGAWVAQEMYKGSPLKGIVTAWFRGDWIANGGWRFRGNPLDLPQSLPPEPDITASYLAGLRTDPFFTPFSALNTAGDGASQVQLGGEDVRDQQNGSATAAKYAVRAWLLAHEIPALSCPAAAGLVEGYEGVDMQENLSSGSWGAGQSWGHGAYKEQPMEMVGRLYQDWVRKGNLKR